MTTELTYEPVDPNDTTMLPTITHGLNGRAISQPERGIVDEAMIRTLNNVLDQHRFELLMSEPPPHAIQKRDDGYPYLPHGYVTLTLNEIFGFDWDHVLLPVFNGNIYEYISAEDAKLPTKNPCVVVFGQLTVRINRIDDRGDISTIATIVKTGFGGSEIRKKMPRGNAVKGAASDSRKVCASQLGPRLGLTLYWNDEAELKDYEDEKLKQKARDLSEQGMTPVAIARELSSNGVVVDVASVKAWLTA